MAGGDDDSESGEVKKSENEVIKIPFKCCVKKNTSAVVCVNCGALFHRSCLERKHGKIGDDPRIQCCSVKHSQAVAPSSVSSQEESTTTQASHGDNETLRMENSFLSRLLQQAEDKNRLLEENIKLLKENKKMLEEKLSLYLINNSKQTKLQPTQSSAGFTNLISYSDKVQQTKNVSTKILEGNSNQTLNNYRENSKAERVKRQETSLRNNNMKLKIGKEHNTPYQDLQRLQEETMADIINLEVENEIKQPNRETLTLNKQSNQEEWKTQRRNKRGFKKTLGQNEEDKGFVGIKPKVWMYIYRIQNSVTEEIIMNYLKEKLNLNAGEELIVRDLQTKGKNKCFMVAADFKYRDDFYSPDFWPKGVGYKRYDFKLQHRNENSASASSFLENT